MNFFERLQHIDRRIMYLLLAVVIAGPLIWGLDLPIVVSPAVRGVYDTVEKMPSDKLAIIVIYWGSGTTAENKPQVEALMRQMMMQGKKFTVLAFDPQGSQFSYDSAKSISKELKKTYGKDWLHFGYRPGTNLVPLQLSFPKDVIGVFETDINGKKLSEIPAMRGIKTIKDIGLIADTTSVGELDTWIAYIYGPYRTPLVYAPTAVIAPEGFNPLDAGQIKGMLTGMKGAAEYEHLLKCKGFATRAAGSLSSSHLLIILLIIAGNIGYVSSRRRRE
ncbi:MAG: hypothetical protein NTU88_02830 [Armatimonadetes bacterium]|nr:hypothetical protein [Armatimonadota bacterium]